MTIDLTDFIFLRHLAEYKAATLCLAEPGLTEHQRLDLNVQRNIHLAALIAYGQKVAT